jgi:hypothetical protein
MEEKLNRYIKEGKPKFITVNKQKIYLSKEKIYQLQEKQKEHEGGLLPLAFLLPFLPAIAKGVAVAAGVGTAAATVANAVNKAKHNKNMEEIEKQKLAEMQKAGSGILVDAADKLEQVPSEAVKWLLRTFKIKKEKDGNGIILRPHEG